MPRRPERDAPTHLDPFFVRARREALIMVASWVACLLWSLGYSHFFGYGVADITLVLGMPSWVFYGILLPWVAATAFSVWFSLCYMQDEEDE